MPRFTPRTKNFVMPEMIDRYPPAGNPPDGYVITYNSADGYYYPKATSKLQLIASPMSSPYNIGGEDIVLVQNHVGTFTVNLPGAVSTTIAAGSNGQSLPQTTINVVSTTGFLSSGTIIVTTNGGPQTVTYTGTTATTFTGCSGGLGLMTTGNSVISLALGTTVYVKDFAGVALANPINVASASLIDGATPYVINVNYGSVRLLFNGSTWSILSKF